MTMPLNPDGQWEAYGESDPYYGVLSSDRFKSDRLDAGAKAEFFESGEKHVDYMMQTIRSVFDPTFRPRRVLDFGMWRRTVHHSSWENRRGGGVARCISVDVARG